LTSAIDQPFDTPIALTQVNSTADEYNPSVSSDGEGHLTQMTFNAVGMPTAHTNALGQASTSLG
jgi:hypothetical protein